MRETKIGVGPEDRTQRDLRDPATLETQVADSRSSAPTVGSGSGVNGGPQRGDAIGRFVVLGVLGSGGMGVVYSAYDPHLDRKVAIKLLSAEAASAGVDAHTRLLREAQAMAKIHHPNVIVVHEVGTLGEQVYLAMEFADGGTLRDWLTSQRREQRDILAVFTQAGRGLAAAHAKGLVHRDFKPDNVLLSTDGTARVTDFGLVGVLSEKEHDTLESVPPMPDKDELSKSGSTPLTADLTQTGAIMGTPRYMAPEQFRGVSATDRTDQFAFCVALYEGLYGERPFAGTTYAELCSNVLTGALLPPPKGARVPGWLRKVLLRGLSIDPAGRYPSMKVLLAALSRDPRRMRTALIATGVAVVCGGAAALALAMHPSHKSACSAGGEHVRAVWNPARRSALQQAFAKAQPLLGGPAFERSSALIDTWTKQWEDGYVGACEATRVQGEQSEHLLDLRMQCLNSRLDAARATIDAAMSGDSDTVTHAISAFAALPPIAPCSDTKALLAAVPPPEQALVAAQVAGVRAELQRARAEAKLGHYKAARAIAEPALVTARATKYPAAIGEAALELGQLQQNLGDAAAITTLREAMYDAQRSGDNTTMIHAAAWLTFTLTMRSAQYDRAHEVAGFAEAAAEHQMPPTDVYVRLEDAIALLDEEQSHLDAAQARYEKTLALAEEKLGRDHAGTMTTLNQLATVYRERGRLDDARKAYERVVESRERLLGKDHPDVASALSNVGIVYREQAKYDEAMKVYERALAISKAAYGPEHPEVANVTSNIASVYADRGDLATAVDYERQALAMREHIYGKDSLALLPSLINMGAHLSDDGKRDEARTYLERGLALSESKPEHDDAIEANILNNLAVIDKEDGKLDEAMTLLERSRVIAAKLKGPESTDVIECYLNEATVLKQQKKLDDAIALEQRILPMAEKAFGPDHPKLAMVLVNLGFHEEQVDRPKDALEHHTRALAIFENKLGKDNPYTSYALLGMGEDYLDLQRVDDAIAVFQRAVDIRQKAGMPAPAIKEATDSLAFAKKKKSHR